MTWMPKRREALDFLAAHVSQDNLVKHCIATEAIMRGLARHFGEDEELWGISGLFHDLDLEKVGEDMTRHALVTAEILREKQFPEEGIHAILAHNSDVLEVPCETTFQICLTAAESITGLIVACALVYPSRKIADVAVKSIRKRMKEKRFAANVSRERIIRIEATGLSMDEFIALSLEAMVGVADEIGL